MISANAFSTQTSHQLHIIKILGEGTHGKVFLALDTASGAEVAMKSIKKNLLTNEKEKKHVRQEIDIMSKLHHPHIISVHRVFETDSEVVLVLEYASGGELFDYINSYASLNAAYDNMNAGGLPEAVAQRVFRQLVSAVQYLHEKQIVHRDLKLENVLLDSKNNAKVADFGLSAICIQGQLLKTYCGSPLYASPEIVNGRPYHGPEVDCWSLGVLLYAMVYGTMPFDGHDFKTLKRQITQGIVQEPTVLSGAHGLILSILNPDLSRRATLADIADHQWLQEGIDKTPSLVHHHSFDVNEHQMLPPDYFDEEENPSEESEEYHCASQSFAETGGCSDCSSERVVVYDDGISVASAFLGDCERVCSLSSKNPVAAIASHPTSYLEGTLSEFNTDSFLPNRLSSKNQVRRVSYSDEQLTTSFNGLDAAVGSTPGAIFISENGNSRSNHDSSNVGPQSDGLACSRLLVGGSWKRFSADSLDRRGLARHADEFGSFSSDINCNHEDAGHSSGDDEHSSCFYDFSDINAVLDGVADPDKVSIEDNDSLLSSDSLD